MTITILSQDLFLIGFLVFLEGILSIDNALVLAMMVKHLPPKLRKKALTYGLAGAFTFRFLALFMVAQLMKWNWVKYVGGGYLLFIAIKHFVFPPHPEKSEKQATASFWKTVVMIELMDVAFAVDSILAAIALTQKIWIVFTGGILGIILMRFAANGFVGLLARFPGLEDSAYLLVGTIGVKLILEGLHLPYIDFHTASEPGFWGFWGTMIGIIIAGLRKTKKTKT
jgi:YkoY family integral membrane protein